jgi:hypothetical protein
MVSPTTEAAPYLALLPYLRALLNEQLFAKKAILPSPAATDTLTPVHVDRWQLAIFGSEPIGGGLLSLLDGYGALTGDSIQNALGALSEKTRKVLSTKEPDDVLVHLFIETDSVETSNFGIKGVWGYHVYDAKVTGARMTLNGKTVDLHPLYATAKNIGHTNGLEWLAEKFELKNHFKLGKERDLRTTYYRGVHLGERPDTLETVVYFRGQAWLDTDAITKQFVAARLDLFAQWFSNSCPESKEVIYRYTPTRDLRMEDDRTLLRSVLVVWVMGKLAKARGDAELAAKAKGCIRYYLNRYFDIDADANEGELALKSVTASTVPFPTGQTVTERWPVGSLLVAAIVDGGFTEYAKFCAPLLGWSKQFLRDNGEVITEDSLDQFFMPGQYLSGHVAHALATGDAAMIAQARAILKTYIGYYEGMLRFGKGTYAPAIAPQWIALPAARMADHLKTSEYDSIMFSMCDRILRWGVRMAEDQIYPDYAGNLSPLSENSYGNVSVTAAAFEALIEGWHRAGLAGDSARKSAYSAQIHETAAHVLRMQFTRDNTYFCLRPEKALGGVRIDSVNTNIWMDNVWHFVSALLRAQALGIFRDNSSFASGAVSKDKREATQ